MYIDKEYFRQGFERFILAAKGLPDRVPISAQMPEHAQRLCGLSSEDFYFKPIPFVKAMLAVHQYYRLDAVYLFYDVYNVEAEALGQPILYQPHSMPDLDHGRPLIKEKRDLENLVPPIPTKSGRMPFVVDICRQFTSYTGLPALTGICAPFSLAVGIRGYAAWVKDLRKDPQFAHDLLRFLTLEVLIPWAKGLKEACKEKTVIFAADAWASPPNIDMRIQEEFVLPYSKILYESVGVAPLGQWGQSYVPDPEKFIENQLAMGMPGIIALDPDAERLGPEKCKKLSIKKGVPLTLGLSSQLLRDGPQEQLMERVKHYLAIGAPGGKLLFFLNYVPADTPPAHIHAVVSRVRQIGQYAKEGLDVSFDRTFVSFQDYLKDMGINDQSYFYRRD
jgi:uroporphyrinogen-III decarboxylase